MKSILRIINNNHHHHFSFLIFFCFFSFIRFLFVAGKPLVHVPKLRFSSKYSGQLRSPLKLKFSGAPLIFPFDKRIVVLIGLLGGKVARIDDLEPLAECL